MEAEIDINKNHSYYWKNQVTRITGNLCHWIDLATYFIDELPKELFLIRSEESDDNLVAVVKYSKGSIANFTVSDKGNNLRGVQEYIEIKNSGNTFFIEYVAASFFSNDKYGS